MSVRVDLGGRRIIKKSFFKQKTAYEILRSDWSSDVCSSDLAGPSAPSFASLSGEPPALRLLPSTPVAAGPGSLLAKGRGAEVPKPPSSVVPHEELVEGAFPEEMKKFPDRSHQRRKEREAAEKAAAAADKAAAADRLRAASTAHSRSAAAAFSAVAAAFSASSLSFLLWWLLSGNFFISSGNAIFHGGEPGKPRARPSCSLFPRVRI